MKKKKKKNQGMIELTYNGADFTAQSKLILPKLNGITFNYLQFITKNMALGLELTTHEGQAAVSGGFRWKDFDQSTVFSGNVSSMGSLSLGYYDNNSLQMEFGSEFTLAATPQGELETLTSMVVQTPMFGTRLVKLKLMSTPGAEIMYEEILTPNIKVVCDVGVKPWKFGIGATVAY